MSSLDQYDARIIDAAASDRRRFLSLVGRGLIDNLFAAFVDGGESDIRSVDGLLLEHEHMSDDSFSGIGIAVFVELQDVEPVSLQLHWSNVVRKLIAGEIRLGAPGWHGAIYGSSKHSKLAARLHTEPDADRVWRWTFRLQDGRWSLA